MNALRHVAASFAASTTATAPHGLLEITTPDLVLYGLDFPYPVVDGCVDDEAVGRSLQRDEFKALGSANAESAHGLCGGLERSMYRR